MTGLLMLFGVLFIFVVFFGLLLLYLSRRESTLIYQIQIAREELHREAERFRNLGEQREREIHEMQIAREELRRAREELRRAVERSLSDRELAISLENFIGSVASRVPPADANRRLMGRTTASYASPDRSKSENIDVSAFSPQICQPGEQALIQVFLHKSGLDVEMLATAKAADPETIRRGTKRVNVKIDHEDRIDVILEAKGLLIDEPVQQIIWHGNTESCQFIVTLPIQSSGRTFYLKVLVLLKSIPICSLKFTLRATAEESDQSTAPIRWTKSRRYRKAFLSYSSLDLEEVVARAQILKAVQISFFQDLLSLDPGERWERRLYHEIDRCDLFLLFWSSHAKESAWVLKETQYALARRESSEDEMPDIIPVILEGPPPPSPPEFMKDIHFNDGLVYVLAAIRNEKARGAEKKPL